MDREIEEIRNRRKQMFRDAYGGSVHALVEDAIEWQKKHPTRVKRAPKAARRSTVSA
ncbi:MAG: hypothetical protein ACI9OU_002028 [Candidatus Promineifilaceae bacterium]|jgi:hypothetical protein